VAAAAVLVAVVVLAVADPAAPGNIEFFSRKE
jgi:hypothetical protein